TGVDGHQDRPAHSGAGRIFGGVVGRDVEAVVGLRSFVVGGAAQAAPIGLVILTRKRHLPRILTVAGQVTPRTNVSGALLLGSASHSCSPRLKAGLTDRRHSS